MSDRRRTSVVLVDPTDDLEGVFADPLTDAGYAVVAVPSAGAALAALERGGVAGFVSRYHLPDLTGVQLLRSVRIFHPNVPFVLVASDDNPVGEDDAVAAEVSHVVRPETDLQSAVSTVEDRLAEASRWIDQESEERYRHLIANVPVPINLFDGTGQSIWCNRAVLDLLGLDDRDEFIGRSIVEFIHPDDRDLAGREIEGVIDDKRSVGPTEMRLLRPDGEVRHIRVSTAIGRFLGADIGQAVAVDLTDLHRARRGLEEERAFVDAALDALDDVFYVLDADGTLVRWNEPTARVTGYDDAELESMPVESFFAEADRDRVSASVQAVLETGSDAVEATVVTKDGARIPYEFRGRRLEHGVGGGTDRVVGIGRDVSARRERDNQLREFEQWLRHNIRNDLTVIDGFAELLARGDHDDPAGLVARIRERSSHLIEQADHQQAVVELITEPAERRPLDVRRVVEGVVDELRGRFPEADITVDGPASLTAVAVPELSMAVEELVENAVVHAEDEAPRVAVGIREDGDAVIVQVRDEGPGIPEDERAVLEVDRDVGPLHHGSGIGLSVVYWVVRNAGGEVEVSSDEEGGSVVSLTLQSPGS